MPQRDWFFVAKRSQDNRCDNTISDKKTCLHWGYSGIYLGAALVYDLMNNNNNNNNNNDNNNNDTTTTTTTTTLIILSPCGAFQR